MLTLEIIYWILGLLGASYMLSSLMGLNSDFESDLDIDDADDSPKVFSLRLLYGSFLGFAIGGGISQFNGWAISSQLIIGVMTALLFGVLSIFLAKIMYKMQGDSSFSMDIVVGYPGVITIQTGKTGKAMVKVSTLNGPAEFICFPNDNRIKFKVGETVKVIARSSNELIVQREIPAINKGKIKS